MAAKIVGGESIEEVEEASANARKHMKKACKWTLSTNKLITRAPEISLLRKKHAKTRNCLIFR